MRLNLWKQAQEMETLILHLESRINDLESTLAAVLSNRKTDMISKERAEDFAERKVMQRIKRAAYARKYYQKKKEAQKEAK
jgi:hypothetical protein